MNPKTRTRVAFCVLISCGDGLDAGRRLRVEDGAVLGEQHLGLQRHHDGLIGLLPPLLPTEVFDDLNQVEHFGRSQRAPWGSLSPGELGLTMTGAEADGSTPGGVDGLTSSA